MEALGGVRPSVSEPERNKYSKMLVLVRALCVGGGGWGGGGGGSWRMGRKGGADGVKGGGGWEGGREGGGGWEEGRGVWGGRVGGRNKERGIGWQMEESDVIEII